MNFKYKGLTSDQEVVVGEINCDSKKEAILYLEEREILPIKISQNLFNWGSKVFNDRELSLFARKSYFLLSGGLSLTDSFEILRDQAKKKKHLSFYQDCLDQLYQGKTLSQIFEKWHLPAMFVSSFQVAEETGQIMDIFKQLDSYYEKKNEIKKTFINSLIYPCILLIVMVAMTQFLSLYVLPIFEEFFLQRGVTLPWYTKALLGMARWTRNYSLLSLLIFVALLIAFKFALRNKGFKYKADAFVYKVPLLSKISHQQLTMHLSRNLSLLLHGGQDLLQAFSILEDATVNLYIKEVYKKIQEDLKEGKELWRILGETELFSSTFPSLVRIGEETASLEASFQHTESLYQEDFLNGCKRVNSLIEPVLLIALSLVVAFIVIGLVNPMFDLINQF